MFTKSLCLAVKRGFLNRCFVPLSVRCISSLENWSSPLSNHWDRAMSDAEKIVGYSTSYFSLRCLLSDEISNVALHLSKLNGTNHPLLETAKRLTYNGHTVMQTRGLLVLLISKAAGHSPYSIDFVDSRKSAGISQRQRFLAEITEMIYSAHIIHRGIMNLQPNLLLQSKINQDLHFGNKMSVLSGDFLLASVWKGLGELRDTKVVELMATAIGDFMEGQFVVETETGFLEEHIKNCNWEQRNFLKIASLQANSCQSALALAGHNETMQQNAYQFGKNFSLAWQASQEMQPFLNPYQKGGVAIDLLSAPVLMHLQESKVPLESILVKSEDGSVTVNFKKLHSMVQNGNGLQNTRDMIVRYTDEALNAIQQYIDTDACHALTNIVLALREQ